MSSHDVFQFAAQQQLASAQSVGGESDFEEDSESEGSASADSQHAPNEPSFASANFATILPEYRNRGQDAVKLAFVPHSFSSIRDLPDRLSHKAVEHALFDKAASNLHNEPPVVAPRKMGYKNLFSQFQYVHEQYDLKKELDAQEREADRIKRLKIGRGKEFKYTSVIEKKLPGQDQFLDTSEGSGSLFFNDQRLRNKYKWQADPIERFQEAVTKERLAKISKNIQGAFVPGGVDSKVDATIPSRRLLPDVLRAVAAAVAKDWADVKIKCVESGSCILVEFKDIDEADAVGVTAYMNIFVKKNPVAVRFKLKKNAVRWNLRQPQQDRDDEDTISLEFAMIPPWIRGKHLHAILEGVKATAPSFEFE